MKSWVFVAKEYSDWVEWLKRRVWLVGEDTRNAFKVAAGDSAVIYSASKFWGTVGIEKRPARVVNLDIPGSAKYPYAFTLKNVTLWPKPLSVKDLVPHLQFFKQKKKWQIYLQGGVKSMLTDDYLFIVSQKV